MKLESKFTLLAAVSVVFGAFVGFYTGFNLRHKQALIDLEVRFTCEQEKATIIKSLNDCYRDETQILSDVLENTIGGRGRLMEGEIDIQVFINDFFNSNSKAGIVCFGRGFMTVEEKDLNE